MVGAADEVPRSIVGFAGRPWLGWLLVCLCRQQALQRWLFELHSKRPRNRDGQSGEVPGLVGWTYHYHGGDLLLEGPGNELLNVDFRGNDALSIDPYFFAERVCALDVVPAPEEQLRRWLWSPELIEAALGELEGVLSFTDDGHLFQLGPALQQQAEHVAGLDFDRERAARWDRLLGESSREVLERFDAWLEDILPRHEQATAGILASLSRPRLVKVTEALLGGDLNQQLVHAVRAAGDVRLDVVEQLSRRLPDLDPKRHHPYIAWEICRYLLVHNQARDECLSTLERFSAARNVKGFSGDPYDYELALLALEHEPYRGLPLLRRALRSKTPQCLERASALLALVDRPWSRAEILAAACEGIHGITAQRTLLAGLLMSSDPLAQEQACQLMPRPHERESSDMGFTFDEVVEANLDAVFADTMDRVRPDLERLDLARIAEAAAALGPAGTKPGLLQRLVAEH